MTSTSTIENVDASTPIPGTDTGPLSDTMIPVQRLCVSIRRTHRRESKMIKQGWLNVKFDSSEVLAYLLFTISIIHVMQLRLAMVHCRFITFQ